MSASSSALAILVGLLLGGFVVCLLYLVTAYASSRSWRTLLCRAIESGRGDVASDIRRYLRTKNSMSRLALRMLPSDVIRKATAVAARDAVPPPNRRPNA